MYDKIYNRNIHPIKTVFLNHHITTIFLCKYICMLSTKYQKSRGDSIKKVGMRINLSVKNLLANSVLEHEDLILRNIKKVGMRVSKK